MTIHLIVKFRAFGITFSTMRQSWEATAHGFESIIPPMDPIGITLLDRNGVRLIVRKD